MNIFTKEFVNGGEIPQLYTGEGRNISLPLEWGDVPKEAKSLVLIVDDPDSPDPVAPKMTWVHWVAYNIPPNTTHLPEGASGHRMPSGTIEGMNDWNKKGYGGPCPSAGRHRYFIKLYALDTLLPPSDHADKKHIEAAMKGHVLASAERVGTYENRGRYIGHVAV